MKVDSLMHKRISEEQNKDIISFSKVKNTIIDVFWAPFRRRPSEMYEYTISVHLLLTFLTQKHFLILHFKNCWENGCAVIPGIVWVDKRCLRLVNGIQGNH